ncbi:MAG: glycosyltransferase [Nocardioides sp.]
MSVTVVLVSHGGARWLPAVLDGIRQQTRTPDRVVAVDTGSRDDSLALLTAALGADAIRTAGRQTSFAEAVDLGLALADETGPAQASEWVWLLHDDAKPAPDALDALLAAAEADPGADILGPKLREWPSLRRLLEVGVTLSATGRRETGLERGEYDQGQHDDVRRVLAVNTAGMLVRRRTLDELGGFERALPIFGNDIDFGWRAAAAGRATLVVPQAVVFHAEAAHRGSRRTSLTGRHTHYQERRAALFTLLANSPTRTLPLRIVRLALGTLLRVLGFLLVRSVGEALDELAALVSLYSRPGQVIAARRARRPLATTDAREVAPLLAPWWLPYRHGLDVVSDLAAAASNQAQDVAERRRAVAAAQAPPPVTSPAGRRPAAHGDQDDQDDFPPDTGLLQRFLTDPVALGVAGFVLAVLVGTRQAWGTVSGGALAAVPAGAADWWRLYTEHWHPLALGSDVPAPPSLAPLALLASVVGGPATAVSLVLVGAVPAALWGAWRLLRVVGRFLVPGGMPRWLLAAGATTYALVPVVAGAWGEGRLGQVVVAATLPWLVHASLGFADPERDRRWRAAWRTGLLLALATAFGPALFFFWLLATLAVLGLGLAFSRALVTDRSVYGPLLVAPAVAPVLLAPWWLPMLLVGRPGGLLLDPGRLPVSPADLDNLLLGRLDGAGAPLWWAVPLVVVAVLALAPRLSRTPALVGWAAALIAAVTALLVALPTVTVAGADLHPSAAALIPVVQGALVVAAVSGGFAVVRSGWFAGDGWPHRLVVLPVTLALVVPAAGVLWFASGDHGSLGDDEVSDIPAYMGQSSELGAEHGVLVVRGDVESGLTYLVRRGDGDTVGEAEVLALTPADDGFSETLRTLVSRPTPETVSELAARGVEYVVLPAPADGRLAAQLDATVGLDQASAENRATRAWKVDEPPAADAVAGPGSTLRTVLLVLQLLAVVVIAVLCGPTWREKRR